MNKRQKCVSTISALYEHVANLSEDVIEEHYRDITRLQTDSHFARVNCLLSGTDAAQVRALADEDVKMWIECCKISCPLFYNDILAFLVRYLTPCSSVYTFAFSQLFRCKGGKSRDIASSNNAAVVQWCRQAIPDALAKPVVCDARAIMPIIRKNLKLFSGAKNNIVREVSLLLAAISHPDAAGNYVDYLLHRKWDKVPQGLREDVVQALLDPTHYRREGGPVKFNIDNIVQVLQVLSELDVYVDVLKALPSAIHPELQQAVQSYEYTMIEKCTYSPWAISGWDWIPPHFQDFAELKRWNRWLPYYTYDCGKTKPIYREYNAECAEKRTNALLSATSLDKDSISIVIAYSVYTAQ